MKKRFLLISLIVMGVIFVTGCDKKQIPKTPDDSIKINADQISFYVPDVFKVNQDNIEHKKYEYYYRQKGDEASVLVTIIDAKDYNNSPAEFIKYYMGAEDKDIKKETINGHEWTTASRETEIGLYLYSTVIGDQMYMVRIRINEKGDIAIKSLDYIKDTLYIYDK